MQIISYPIPKMIIEHQEYLVRVRLMGGDWQEIPCYQANVNMHDLHQTSICTFDFCGEIEVEISGPSYIYEVKIRPLSKEISFVNDTKKVQFKLKNPINLSIEINKERNRNLHLFANPLETDKPTKDEENIYCIHGEMNKPTTFGQEIIRELEKLPKNRTLIIKPGIYYITESVLRLPSNTNVYLEGGAVIIGGFICSKVENVKIYGRGILYQKSFHRFSSINGIRISHSKNITINGIMFINPPHYTVYIGGSDNIMINDIKGFSCEGWSDGIDIMSSRNIYVHNVFLRNSDDCIAIYGSRWNYKGDSKNIHIKNSVLWADVAHPTNIGTHGDYNNGGDIIEEVFFENIDILEHNEYQEEYLGCLAISAGDDNQVRNIYYRNICIEPFLHGRVVDLQIKHNKDYNPIPGRNIQNIYFERIYDNSEETNSSVIRGFSKDRNIENVYFSNIYRQKNLCFDFKEMNLDLGPFVKDIVNKTIY